MKKVYYVYETGYDGGVPLFVTEDEDTAYAVAAWLRAKQGYKCDVREIALDSTDDKWIFCLFEGKVRGDEQPVSVDTILRWYWDN